MLFGEALSLAGQIIDDMFNTGTRSRRFEVNEENQPLINELVAACAGCPWLEWHAMGEATSGLCFFVIRTKLPTDGQGEAQVINVDFKNRRVLSTVQKVS